MLLSSPKTFYIQIDKFKYKRKVYCKFNNLNETYKINCYVYLSELNKQLGNSEKSITLVINYNFSLNQFTKLFFGVNES